MKSRCCLCVCVLVRVFQCIFPIVPRQRLGKNYPIVARQRLGGTVTAVTNTHATKGGLFYPSFAMWPVSYQGK
jgi:hypothetical protein